jgi:PAS domain-containing protein
MPKKSLETDQSKIFRLEAELSSLRFALDEIGAYIFTKDINGCYTFANGRVLELFEMTLDQIIGKDDSHFFDLSKSNEIRVNDQIVLSEGRVLEVEEVNFSKAANEFKTYWSVKKPIRDSAGEVIGLCGLLLNLNGS